MRFDKLHIGRQTAVALLALAVAPVYPTISTALETVDVNVIGAIDNDRRKELQGRLSSASLTVKALDEKVVNSQDVLGSARSDYARMIGVLYDEGYYGPSVSIRVDQREAADMDPFSAPGSIRSVVITVDTGPRFRFGKTSIEPRAPQSGTAPLADGFATGEFAKADLVGTAANNAVTEWREAGHAKADVESQVITADHPARRLDVDIDLDPGRQLRFGDVTIGGDTDISQKRLRQILGWPQGEVYSPEELRKSVNRLRRTGVFSTVSATEDELPNPDDTLDYAITLAEQKPRRFGVSAEYSTLDGILLGGFWLHRNLFGGAEKFRVDAEISNIGLSEDDLAGANGIDYLLDMRLTRPAAYGPDNDAFVFGNFERNDEPDYLETQGTIGVGLSRYFSDQLYGEISGGYRYSQVEDDFGDREFQHLVLPSRLEWDTRDEPGDATKGFYVDLAVQPYIGLSGSETGIQTDIDARTYYGIGAEDKVVLAGRLQLGNVFGSSIEGTPPDFLFFSGGGDTVRGQKYESLGVTIDGNDTGGRSFVGLSTEVRTRVTKSLGIVGFFDAGFVGPDSTYSEAGNWQSGVGLGVRYATPIGPLRFDLATPVAGDRDQFSTAEIYIGVGQAF